MKGAPLAILSAIFVAIILVPQLPVGAALAQDGRSPAACFDFVSPQPGVTPGSVLKVNKCTGEAWMLTRTRLTEAKPNNPGTYAYRWVPISHDEKEAVFPLGQ
jgi:hypothetical protein